MDIENEVYSWTDSDLLRLSDLSNHRINYDGYGFIWEHSLVDGIWELHSVFKYREYKYYMHVIHFHLPKWKAQLDKRIKDRKVERTKELMSQKRIFSKIDEINSFKQLKMKDKVLMVSKLLPDESKDYIAKVLGVSKQLVSYHLK